MAKRIEHIVGLHNLFPTAIEQIEGVDEIYYDLSVSLDYNQSVTENTVLFVDADSEDVNKYIHINSTFKRIRPGDNYIITDGKVYSNNFSIEGQYIPSYVKGPKGDPGPQGPQGEQGPTGPSLEYSQGNNITIAENVISSNGYVYKQESNAFIEGENHEWLKDTLIPYKVHTLSDEEKGALGFSGSIGIDYDYCIDCRDNIIHSIIYNDNKVNLQNAYIKECSGSIGVDGNIIIQTGETYFGKIGLKFFNLDLYDENGDYITLDNDTEYYFSYPDVGNNSHSEASDSIGVGGYSHAEGRDSIAIGNYSHAEGSGSIGMGELSHAEGAGSIGMGDSSHAEGEHTLAIGNCSHAEGRDSIAIGNYSHAEGCDSIGIGDFSHAEGLDSTAHGYASHAEGSDSTAHGYASHAEGYYTTTTNEAEHAEGKYNVSNTGTTCTISSIGIGTSDADRMNAVEVLDNGDTFIYGVGDYNGANINATNTKGERLPASIQEVLPKYNKEKRSICFQYNEADNSLNEAQSDYSFVIGYNNKAIREETAETGLTLQAANTFVGGMNNRAYHSNSIVFGEGLFTQFGNTFVLGKYNGTVSNQDGWGDTVLGIVGDGYEDSNGNVTGRNVLLLQGGSDPALHCRGGFKNNASWINDFGEYFEWLDGNPDNEDRIGYMVQLNGGKIELATSLKKCIGVISGTTGFIGGVCAFEWHDKFLHDKWGREIIGEDGNPILNPDYDPDLEYIPREQRKEWDVVGLVGQVITRQDGTLEVGGYAGCSKGIATKATTGFRVLKIIDNETALLLVK